MKSNGTLLDPSFFLVPLIVLFLFAANGYSQADPTPGWDDDGGFEADYRGIPILQWTGPGTPGTYREYIEKRGALPFRAEPVLLQGTSSGGDSLKALVLVNDTLYAAIQPNLDVYVLDLEYDGFVVEVYKTSGGTATDLKTFILNHSDNLEGCTFIGDHPAAWFEFDYWGHEEFPIDLYFMDLDGAWIDGDSDGKWDSLLAGNGDEGPEIHIGRIDASMMSGDEATLTNAYLLKNHEYRKGGFFAPHFGLTYTEDDWNYIMDMRTSIKLAYPDYEDIPAPDTNRNDYLYNRVPDKKYEFIQLACHSSPFSHYFTRGGQATNTQIKNIIPHAMFFNLFCCSSLRFTENNFLGGSYIYNDSLTSLAVIGSTKTGSMLNFNAFYKPFAQETLGEAFRQWFNTLAPYSSSEIAWHFGMTIAGDPFLRTSKPPFKFDFPEGLTGASLPPGPEVRLTLEIIPILQNTVPATEYVHYRYDPGNAFTKVPLTAMGGHRYETVLPHTAPGDQPEFYFSAQGDHGTTLTSPPDAPAETYSFRVCFVEPLFEDDFESDLGWTVVNENVFKGKWQREDPEGTPAQPENDHTAQGTHCFVTGPIGGNISDYDLDGGPTRLISPAIDLSGGDGEFSFHVWFYHSEDGIVQPMRIHVSNDDGANWTPVDPIYHNPEWQVHSYTVSEYVTPTDQVRVRFTARDQPDNSIVEALVDDFSLGICNFTPSLWSDAYSISVASGGIVQHMLDAGTNNAGRSYLLLGSSSGTSPGFKLPGGQHVPLNWDLLTDLILNPSMSSIFKNFMGTLDGSGKATASLDTLGPLNNPALIGLETYFAFVLGPPPGWDYASNVIPLTFDP